MMRKSALFLSIALLFNAPASVYAEQPSSRFTKYATIALVGASITYALCRHYDLSLATVVNPKKLIKAIRDKHTRSNQSNVKTATSQLSHVESESTKKPTERESKKETAQNNRAHDNKWWHINPEKLITEHWKYNIIDHDPSRRIWQVENKIMENGWSCGPSTIHNAFAVEKLLGINKVSDDIELLKNYLEKHGISIATGGVPTTNIYKITRKLMLNDFYILYKNNEIEHDYGARKFYFNGCRLPDIAEPKIIKSEVDATNRLVFEVDTPCDWSDKRLKDYFIQCVLKKLNEMMKSSIKNIINNNEMPAVIHFGCMVPEPRPHIFLISVIKLPHEKPFLLIIDNLNEQLHFNELTHTYAHHIADMLGI